MVNELSKALEKLIEKKCVLVTDLLPHFQGSALNVIKLT